MTKDQSKFNGAKCDTLVSGFNSGAKDHHSQWLIRNTLNHPDYQKNGWRIDVARYDIVSGLTSLDKRSSDPFGPDHSNVQLIGPDGKMITSIDVWSLNKSDGATNFYSDQERLGVVLDDCKADNVVVRDGVETGRAPVLSGSGPDVLSKWLQMTELANRAAYDPNLIYVKFPDPNTSQFNSNSLPFALIEGVGLKYPNSFFDLSGGNSFSDVLPGRDQGEALKGILLKSGKPYFASVPPSKIGDPEHRAEIQKTVDGLKLEAVQAEICRDSKNEAGCVVPVPVAP